MLPPHKNHTCSANAIFLKASSYSPESDTIYPDDRLGKIDVFYKEERRFVKCFCGETVKTSIVPHLRRKHSSIWKEWGLGFVRLWNEGKSYKQIMKEFSKSDDSLLFSWTVIEKEIKKIAESSDIALHISKKPLIKSWEPRNFDLESTTVWSFPKRGSWAVHKGDYRGNWTPQVPRNLIQKYTKPKEDLVFDPFVGGGTTLIEAWLANRRSIGIDISPIARKFTETRLEELFERDQELLSPRLEKDLKPGFILGDARHSVELLKHEGVEEGEVDLVCAHPPYLNSLRYTLTIDDDLSRIRDVSQFCKEMYNVALELHKLLKDGGVCATLIGDVRKNRRLEPLGFKMMETFQGAGFTLKEIIVKLQHQDKSTEFYIKKGSLDYLISHEYLLIFEK